MLASCAAALAGIALPSAVTGAPGGKHAASLRAHQTQLAQRSHDALLELYSIETRLERARARISALDQQETRLKHKLAALKTSLRLARRTIAVTQRNLADRARALYESGNLNDPIAIMLGAVSIDDAVTRLENMEQITTQENATLRQAREAQSKFLSLKTSLERRTTALERLRYSARVSVGSLEAARAAKASTIHRLSSQRALTGRQLANLSKQATTAAVTSIKVSAPSGASHTSRTAPQQPSGGSITAGRKLTVSSTCYCLTGGTASGLPVGPGIIATDPSVIPLGTRVFVPGYGNAVAADTGSAVKGLDIDLWVASCAQASAYGRRTVTITIL
jgi:3D (Asp-Asp-Asp) domain-containing protein/chaperonin cofactor prefoldin